MNRALFLIISTLILSGILAISWSHLSEASTNPVSTSRTTRTSPASKVVKQLPAFQNPPLRYSLPESRFVSQSFNNCGPASLSMVLSMFGHSVDQETLADRMRPFHNPAGGVDDKSIFAHEFVLAAQEEGFLALERPNGDIQLLKTLIANGIPVVVRTWLHPNEDIGHFRIVRGYDDETKTLIQDDSYQGPNLSYSYEEFLSMWQPFNYGYILIYPKEKKDLVMAILGGYDDERKAYEQSIRRAEEELVNNPQQVYPYFNIASASYYLGKYDETIANYEKVAGKLPSRMLWYQLEPIEAYLKTGQDQKVLDLTSSILENGNQAYSELYYYRGEVYKRQGKADEARWEFEKALYYNKNFKPAKEALNSF